jgi:hypothetical protein
MKGKEIKKRKTMIGKKNKRIGKKEEEKNWKKRRKGIVLRLEVDCNHLMPKLTPELN